MKPVALQHAVVERRVGVDVGRKERVERRERGAAVRLIPVRVTDNFDTKQCQKPWVRRGFVVDANPPKVQTRIR